MEIIPAILTQDLVELNALLRRVRESGKFGRVQVDFVDEAFGNRTVGVGETHLLDFKPLLFDAHLMISGDDVQVNVREAMVVGFERIIAQVESVEDQSEYVRWVSEEGEGKYKPGLAVDLETDVEEIKSEVLPKLDVVLLMAVKAGRAGQKFDAKALEKVRELGQIRREKNYKFRICVDGGVEREHIELLSLAGVDEAAVGARRALGW